MNSLLSANLSSLQQGIEFIQALPGPAYVRPCEDVFNSTIGGHMRHNLDHYAAFVSGLDSGYVDYDARERDPAIENEPKAAIRLMQQLIQSLEKLEEESLDRKLQIRMDDGGDSSWSHTSLRRELQFLLSHTIHHYALIVSIASRYGVSDFPDGFGVAPSTLHYQAGTTA